MVHGTNPAFTLPPAAGFNDAFAAAGFRVSFASAMDETAALADLILPDRNPLEAWGDSNPRPGVYALRQPAMQPVPRFDTKQAGDVLLSVANRMGRDLGVPTFFDYLRRRWGAIQALAQPGGDFDAFWREALRSGVVQLPAPAQEEPVPLRSPDTALSFDLPGLDGDGDLVLMVYPSPRFGDGRHSDRPWLQELPDPVSKITWHSWLEVNPGTAERLGLRDGDMARVRSPYGEVEVPVWRYPGVREDVVALAMGGGHWEYGRFANGRGVNAMALLPAEVEQPSGALVKLATRVSVDATGEHRPLATIAGASEQHGRPIAPAVALVALGGGPEEARREGEGPEAEEGGSGMEEGGLQHRPEGEELKEIQAMGGFSPVATEGRPEDFPWRGAVTASTIRRRTLAGPWPSTWTSAPAAAPVSPPASPRTTSPGWARTR